VNAPFSVFGVATACVRPFDTRKSPFGEADPLLERIEAKPQGVTKGLNSFSDIVQFSCPVFFVEKDEGELTMDVMRLGTMKGKVSCSWTTVEGSATSPKKFTAASGTVIFPDGGSMQQIKVRIVSAKDWAATLEFQCKLSDPVACELGIYLHTGRIKIIDNECFPSDKFRTQIKEGHAAITMLPDFQLFAEFWLLVYKNNGIGWRTILTLCMDQMSNAYRLLLLWIGIYMVDVLFNTKDPDAEESLLVVGDRNATSVVIAFLIAGPIALLHLWDLVKGRLNIKGLCRFFLQTNLFRKYLNYNEKSRRVTPVAEISAVIMSDCQDLAEGYVAALQCLLIIGKLFVVMGFTLMKNPGSSVFMVAMGVILSIFAYFRNTMLQKADDLVSGKEVEMLQIVQDISSNYPLIAHYMQRPQANERFAGKADEMRQAAIPCSNIRVNNNYCAKWLGPAFTCLYMILKAPGVLSDPPNPTLGAFLATVKVFESVGNDFGDLYKELMQITRICGALKGLTTLLNRETDLKAWKAVNRQRRERTKEERETVISARDSARGSGSPVQIQAGRYITDTIPIKLTSMAYRFDPKHEPYQEGRILFEKVSLQIHQGAMVGVLGQHGSGKSTFMRLLGHQIFPTSGEIFIPTHLRILLVSQEPILLDLTCWENVMFGVKAADTDPQRVEKILLALGADKILQLIQKDLLKHPKALQRLEQEKIEVNRRQSSKQSSGAYGSHIPASQWREEMIGGFKKSMEGGCAGLLEKCMADDDDDEIEQAYEDSHHEHWANDLSYSEKCKLHVARALIMNPEVMVMQRPLYHYGVRDSKKILQAIRDHVDCRGLEMPLAGRSKRRPRTVIFSTETDAECKICDAVWELQNSVADGECSHVAVKR